MDPKKNKAEIKIAENHDDMTKKRKLDRDLYFELLNTSIQLNFANYTDNPRLRADKFSEIQKKLLFGNLKILNSNINQYLLKKNCQQPVEGKGGYTIDEHLTYIRDHSLNAPLYAYHKNAILKKFNQNILEELDKAQLDRTFSDTFYVYKDRFGKETKTPISAWHYFAGVPQKNPNKFFYALDWLSYIGGGFAISPMKNTLKLLIEYVPNYLATRFDNRLKRLANEDDSFSNKMNGTLTALGYMIFKPLWVLGRAITSPITSAKAGWKTGFAFGSKLGGNNPIAKNLLGTLFGTVLGLPSLVIGAAAVIATVVFVPGTLIWAVGKIPVVGVEAAAWLTSASQTVGALSGVSEMAASQSLIARTIAPAFAATIEFGFSGLATLIKAGQGLLNMIGKLQSTPAPTPPSPRILQNDENPAPAPLGGSWVLLNQKGIELSEEKSPKHYTTYSPTTLPSFIPALPKYTDFPTSHIKRRPSPGTTEKLNIPSGSLRKRSPNRFGSGV